MKRLVSMALLLLVLVGIQAGASTFLAMSQRDLIQASQAVVQGQVLKVNSFWEPSGRIIVTEALVKVDEAIVGKSPSVVIVRTFGGTVGGYTVEAHGFPTFQKNDRVLLFLEPEQNGLNRVTGYQQGQFRLVRNKAGQEIAVPAMELGTRVITRDGRSIAAPRPIALDTLKGQIRAEAARLGRD